jgi:3-polyprenyl-4-hydroxybenzoate decarboxylase
MTGRRVVEVPANAGFVIEACVDPREPLREDAPKH